MFVNTDPIFPSGFSVGKYNVNFLPGKRVACTICHDNVVIDIAPATGCRTEHVADDNVGVVPRTGVTFIVLFNGVAFKVTAIPAFRVIHNDFLVEMIVRGVVVVVKVRSSFAILVIIVLFGMLVRMNVFRTTSNDKSRKANQMLQKRQGNNRGEGKESGHVSNFLVAVAVVGV